MPKRPREEVEHAAQVLGNALHRGQKIYTILRHGSASGTMREISPVIGVQDGTIANLTYYVAVVMGAPIGKHGGIKIPGGGMDMGFHLVHELGLAMFGDGYAFKHEWL